MNERKPSVNAWKDPRVLNPAHDRLLDQMLVAVLLFLFPTLLSSLTPSGGVGWGPKRGPELIIYGTILCLLLLRKRVSVRNRSIIFLTTALLVSTWTMLAWGLLGNGPIFFLASSLLAALLFGARGGAVVLGLSTVAMLAVWWAWASGWCRPDFDVMAELGSPTAWTTAISCAIALGVVFILCLKSIFDSMAQSFLSLRTKTEELEAANKRLQEEVRRREQLEASLLEERQFSEGVIDSLPGGFYVYDQDSLLIRWNKNLETFSRLKPEALRKRHLLDWFSGDDRAAVDQSVREALDKGRARCSVTLTRADGLEVPYELVAKRLDVGGKRYLLGLGLDMLDRKLREEEQARLATLIRQLPEGVIVTDPGGVILYVNRRFEKMTGYSAAEVVGQTPRMLKSGQHDVHFYRDMWNTLLRGDTWHGQIINKNKQGVLYSEEATISPVRDANGRIINYLAIKRDLTQQLAMEARLRQAQKMEAIGTLAGGIAHDFNNILTGILGYTALAMSAIPKSDTNYKHLEQVTKAGHRASELVAQILTFSRQKGRERKPLFLHVVAKEALNLLRASIPSTIEIRQAIDVNCGAVLADATEMHQVIMNLCANAYQAMLESGGILTVGLKQVKMGQDETAAFPELSPGSYVRLSVSDTGHGMTKETLARIFEPYYTTKERGEGTGLGLSTVHGIVQECGGAVLAESEVGSGSTFHVFLPVGPSPRPATMFETPIEVRLSGTERVLLVDDEESNTHFAKMALEKLGYTVTTMVDSMEALALFRADPGRFDVVITDQMMPRMTGTELSMNMLAYRPDIPIILCSGFADLLDGLRKEEIGIRDFIMKPVTASDLARAIRSIMDTDGASERL